MRRRLRPPEFENWALYIIRMIVDVMDPSLLNLDLRAGFSFIQLDHGSQQVWGVQEEHRTTSNHVVKLAKPRVPHHPCTFITESGEYVNGLLRFGDTRYTLTP
jgi:hypothetical protein